MLNALTIDLEDWYHTHLTTPEDSTQLEDRVVVSTEHLLSLLATQNAKATFFVLGSVAKRHPKIISLIASQGHEIATHGWSHRLVYELGPDAFRQELSDSKKLLEDISGQKVIGHRAACWSITEKSLWALDILKDEGFAYDSSIFPTKNYLFGIPDSPRFAHKLENGLWEFPPTTSIWKNKKFPIAGGFYFRALPFKIVDFGLRKVHQEGYPAIMYFHPWEFDVNQPRNLRAPWLDRFIHYHGLSKAESKFSRLLGNFQFTTLNKLFQRELGLQSASAKTQTATSRI